MCGICGIVATNRTSPIKREDFQSMVNVLYHRGPDDQGVFFDHNIALGLRRLSVIDLKTGHQPMPNENKTLWIVFNGMIYNYLELRRHLEAKGYFFRTQSDTEVILHLYEEYGADCVLWLNGMFAFAIWEAKQQKLFLARDRLGVKPLYYTSFGGYFLFASEIKALLKFPGIKKEMNLRSVSEYLALEYVPTADSMFEDIKKLLPAHTLIYAHGQLSVQRYWDIVIHQNCPAKNNLDEALSRLSELLKDAVRIRLISDVPVGVFLSGGLDSSLVTALCGSLGSSKIKTFSIGFDKPSFDESHFSRRVAGYFHTQHYEKMCTHREVLNLIPALVESLDEPFADASILPTYLLSKFAKEQITVALSGDGGDELFAGYSTYIAHRIANYFSLLPAAVSRGMLGLAKWMLPVSMQYMSFDFRFKKFFAHLHNPAYIRHHLWLGSFSPQEQKQLFCPWVNAGLNNYDIFNASQNHFYKLNNGKLLDQLQYLDLQTYLPGIGLARVDAASMANSLEVRSPFLDYRLMEFVLNLPQKFRLHHFTRKYILKKYAQQMIPKRIIHRYKKGFGVPVSLWIGRELKNFVLEILSEENINRQGLFHYPYIKRLLEEHFNRQVDNHKKIWTLLMFELWRKKIWPA